MRIGCLGLIFHQVFPAQLRQCLPIYCTCRPFQSQRICSEHCFASRLVAEASVLYKSQQHEQPFSAALPCGGKHFGTQHQELRRLTVVVEFSVKFPERMLFKASTSLVLLVSAPPAPNARMMRQATKRICAISMPTSLS